MNIQYGFAKFRSTYVDHDNDEQLFGNTGDIMMFSRDEETLLLRTFSDNLDTKVKQFKSTAKAFNDYFKVVNNIYLLCIRGLTDQHFTFIKDVVYQFNGKTFQSLYSEQPWNSDGYFPPFGEQWHTTNFFLSGKWMFDLDFRVISKKEAFEFKKSILSQT